MQDKERYKNLKILTLFIISNLCTFLLFCHSEISESEFNKSDSFRPDYIQFKIRANLKTALTFNTPLVLTNLNRNLYIPYLFIIEKYPENSQLIENENSNDHSEYLISVHKKYLSTILEEKEFVIFPQLPKEMITRNTIKRNKRYEITL